MQLSEITGATKLPVARIKDVLNAATFEELPNIIGLFEHDTRKQVISLLNSARRRHEKERLARERVLGMYERMHALGGNGLILGLDEVGRGPLAGPLTVAAVALPATPLIWGINDSKQLTAEAREVLASEILTHAVAIGICHVEPEAIDEIGMAAALRQAMLGAIENSGVDPDAVLIDGVPLHIHPRETSVVKGDATVACIGAASIVAKVTRDAMMVAADELYPGYGFASNKGYGSADHIAAIQELGLSKIHRKSFCTRISPTTE